MSIGIKIAVDATRYGGFSAQAQAWKAKIVANGGTIPDNVLAIYDTHLFIPMGSALDELDLLYCYVGLSGYEIAARTSLVGTFLATNVNSATFDNNGVKSNGTSSYLNLKYNTSTQSVKFLLNDNTLFSIVKTPPFTGNIRTIGTNGAASKDTYVRRTSTNIQIRNNSTNTNSNQTNITSSGNVFLATKRLNSTTALGVINSSEVSGTVASVGLDNLDVFSLTSNGAGSPAGEYDTAYHRCDGAGKGSTFNSTLLRTCIDNLCTALGV
jgi:hypothetical protein